ncbi:MAG TPA: host attachment protein [Burkholderiales bacterium]|nr:host attachment protein [Burkholderiales bacterium]
MKTTWIVAADSSRARMLQVTGREQRLEEIEDLLNPEGRLHDRELASDSLGRWSGPDRPGGNSMLDPVSPSEHVVQRFAKRVGDYLEKARGEHRFDELVLIAPPKFLGALRSELGKETARLVAEEIPKDLSWFEAREIERYVKR